MNTTTQQTTNQIKIAGKTFNVDLDSLKDMAFRIDTSANISLFEVVKTLRNLINDQPELQIQLEYALKHTESARKTISQLGSFYEVEN